jgi:predicted permease
MPGATPSIADLGRVLLSTTNANANVSFLVLLGVAATFKGVFDQKGISDLGKLVYHISLPCLLLCNILKEITLEHAWALCILPTFCFLHVSFAYYCTRFLNFLFGVPEAEARPVLATVMFGNVGALAIALMQALCTEHPFDEMFGGRDTCSSKSTSFIAFYLVTQNIIMFTWGESILIKVAAEEKRNKIHSGTATPVLPFLARRNLADEENRPRVLVAVPSLSAMGPGGQSYEQEEEEDILGAGFTSTHPGDLGRIDERELELRLTAAALQEVSSRLPLEVKAWHPDHHGGVDALRKNIEEDDFLEDVLVSEKSRRVSIVAATCCGKLYRFVSWPIRYIRYTTHRWSVRRCYKGTRRRCLNFRRATFAMLQNPPLQAAAVGLVLGIIPQTKALFIGDQAPFRSVFNALNTLGGSQVPVSMLMLSGSGTLRYLQKAQKLLEKTYGDEQFSFTSTSIAIMILGRLICIPIFGWASWWVFHHFKWLPDDPLIGFVLLIESAVPSAQNVVMLLLVHGELAQGQAMAEVILWQYAAAIPIFTMISSLFTLIIADSA